LRLRVKRSRKQAKYLHPSLINSEFSKRNEYALPIRVVGGRKHQPLDLLYFYRTPAMAEGHPAGIKILFRALRIAGDYARNCKSSMDTVLIAAFN
jgi:hypothetical protein